MHACSAWVADSICLRIHYCVTVLPMCRHCTCTCKCTANALIAYTHTMYVHVDCSRICMALHVRAYAKVLCPFMQTVGVRRNGGSWLETRSCACGLSLFKCNAARTELDVLRYSDATLAFLCCTQAVAGGPGQPCVTNSDISPWGQPALLYGVPQGLLTSNNRTYDDRYLCCGGLMTFTFTVPPPPPPPLTPTHMRGRSRTDSSFKTRLPYCRFLSGVTE